jgi:hypothetical protein
MTNSKTVLVFKTFGPIARMATLHDSTCQVVHGARGSRNGKTRVIETDVADEMADLIDREYPVTRCRCVKVDPV